MGQISTLQKRIWANKLRKGFNTQDIDKELIHLTEELGELMHAYRREGKAALAEEATDIVILLLGFFSFLGMDAEKEILKKITKNEKRKYIKSQNGPGHIDLTKSH